MKNKKKYLVLPIVGLAVASLAMASTPVSAKKATLESASKKCNVKLDSNLDYSEGKDAGWLSQRLACGESAPLKATGKPITIGFISVEGPA